MLPRASGLCLNLTPRPSLKPHFGTHQELVCSGPVLAVSWWLMFPVAGPGAGWSLPARDPGCVFQLCALMGLGERSGWLCCRAEWSLRSGCVRQPKGRLGLRDGSVPGESSACRQGGAVLRAARWSEGCALQSLALHGSDPAPSRRDAGHRQTEPPQGDHTEAWCRGGEGGRRAEGSCGQVLLIWVFPAGRCPVRVRGCDPAVVLASCWEHEGWCRSSA